MSAANGQVPPTVQDEGTMTKPPTEIAKDVAIIFLAGVAIVLGLLLVTYLIMVIMDKYCCCVPGWQPVGDTVEIDHGPVARKAGLWGLRQEERQVILEQILVVKPYSPDTFCDEENPSPEGDDDNPKVETPSAKVEEEENEEVKEESGSERDLSDLDEAVCAICLSEYVDGEMVLSGTSCNHLFHKSCAFEWLSKHDHCPCCRKEMMTADEMRATAQDLLGEERILEMRMWGPSQELARNNFEDYNETPASNVNNATRGSVELTHSQRRVSVGDQSV